MANAGDMAALGASEGAAYRYPLDTPVHREARTAFCAGAAWAADEIERLRAALKPFADIVATNELRDYDADRTLLILEHYDRPEFTEATVSDLLRAAAALSR